MKNNLICAFAVPLAAFLAVGCETADSGSRNSRNDTTPAVSRPSKPMMPVAASPTEPVPTPSPTPTPAPTPSPTPTPRPTPSPTPSPIPSPTPSPTPGPVPIADIAQTFPEAAPATIMSAEDRQAYEAKPYPRIKVSRGSTAVQDPAFNQMLESLKQAIARKDLDGLVAHVAEDRIMSDAGGPRGMADFLTRWKLTYAPRQSEIWNELGHALELGVGHDAATNSYFAPAITLATPYADKILDEHIQPEDRAIVGGVQVRARTEPSQQAEQVEQLTNEIVKLAGKPDPATQQTIGGETHPWWPVILYNGKKAYIFGKFIRPMESQIARFEKIGDQWKLVEFVGRE